jgi:regulator of replication initiation timing
MSQKINPINDNLLIENLLIDINTFKSEIVSLNKKIDNLIEKNNDMAYDMSKLMSNLASFADDVKYDLHYIRNK